MKIRVATEHDIFQISQLFYDTVCKINRKDYTEEQIVVWSEHSKNDKNWLNNIKTQFFVVAENNSDIIGFASLDDNACVDFMYVHENYQGIGVATKLLINLESEAYRKSFVKIWSDVSITAKTFFIKKGFSITKVYTKKVHDVDFENTIMIKPLV